jgi:hypothetical protein
VTDPWDAFERSTELIAEALGPVYREKLEREELERRYREKMMRDALGETDAASDAEPSHPRQDVRRQLPIKQAEALQVEIDKRIELGNPSKGEWTQPKIEERVGVSHRCMREAQDLREAGWDLTESDPDTWADPGHVRWPTLEKARKLLS